MNTLRARTVPTALAAAAGLLAASAGFATGEFVAARLGGTSPLLALGSRVIDMSPGWLKDVAVQRLGSADKPVLLGTVFVVVALLSAAVGVLAARRVSGALSAATFLFLLVLLASVRSSLGWEFTHASVWPAVSALLVGTGVLWIFFRSASSLAAQDRTSTGPAPLRVPSRRGFLEGAVLSGVAIGVGSAAGATAGSVGEGSRRLVRLPTPAVRARPVAVGSGLNVRGLTPFLTSNDDFYRVDVALQVPKLDVDRWRLRIHGMVEREVELTFADLLGMPLHENRFTLTCVSNQVGDTYAGNATWLGVPTRNLFADVGIDPVADCVVSTGADDMTISTPLAALTDPRGSLLAVGMNGEPLPLSHGFPARLVVPGLYGYVSATKWVTELEVTTFAKANTYWTQRGWAEQAPIKTMSRIDVPRQFARVKAGPVQVAGVAWAQRRGITGVEVRVDGGAWQPAQLAEQDSIDTWRPWVREWQATPGEHKLEVRATDGRNLTQTSERVPPRPAGATGWHSVTVTVQ